MREVLPGVLDATRELASDLIIPTLGMAEKGFSEVPRTDTEMKSYADVGSIISVDWLSSRS